VRAAADSAGWYYYGPRAANSGLPKRASLKSFIRSTTLSLGSIAFGSLIVTILELLRLILQSVQQYEAGQGDSACAANWLRAATIVIVGLTRADGSESQ
jgi:hypothetical protein